MAFTNATVILVEMKSCVQCKARGGKRVIYGKNDLHFIFFA